jgi:hypothetical protein
MKCLFCKQTASVKKHGLEALDISVIAVRPVAEVFKLNINTGSDRIV